MGDKKHYQFDDPQPGRIFCSGGPSARSIRFWTVDEQGKEITIPCMNFEIRWRPYDRMLVAELTVPVKFEQLHAEILAIEKKDACDVAMDVKKEIADWERSNRGQP